MDLSTWTSCTLFASWCSATVFNVGVIYPLGNLVFLLDNKSFLSEYGVNFITLKHLVLNSQTFTDTVIKLCELEGPTLVLERHTGYT